MMHSYLNWDSWSSGVKLTSATAATLSAFLVGAYYVNKNLKNKPPARWRQIGEISNLYIYPVKSCKGLKMDSFECTNIGPSVENLRDRVFLITRSNGNVITARGFPHMLLIKPDITGTILTLTAPDCSPIQVDFDVLDENKRMYVSLWGNKVAGVDCGDEVAAWLSKYILKEEDGLRLLYHPENEAQKSFRKDANLAGVTKATDTGKFSDALSFNLLSETSVKELNSRLENPVTPLQFRPNFVVKGVQLIPYEEDNWTWVKIGDVVFQYLTPCLRCTLTTINPETGVKDLAHEPVVTLRKYRELRDPETRKIMGDSPALGIYLGLRNPGTVKVGDPVYIPF